MSRPVALLASGVVVAFSDCVVVACIAVSR